MARGRVLLAAAAALIGIGAAFPAPAGAGVAAPSAEAPPAVFLPDTTIAVGAPDKVVDPIVVVDGFRTLDHVTVVIDYSALAGR